MSTQQHPRFLSHVPFFGKAHRHKTTEPEFSGCLSPQKFGEAIEDEVNFSGATESHSKNHAEPHEAGLTAMNDPNFFRLNPFETAHY